MKEKEKGKVNPFIKELRPDEEILWFSMQPPVPRWTHLIGFILPALVTILFMACFFGIFLTIFGLGDFSGPEGVTGEVLLARFLHSLLECLTVIALLSFPIFVILYVLYQHNTRKLPDAYAVTNQRLLYKQDGISIQAQRLDEIEALRAHKHAVTFVQTFAQMNDIEEVAHLMEDARNRLLEQKGKFKRQEMPAKAPIAFDAEDALRQAKR